MTNPQPGKITLQKLAKAEHQEHPNKQVIHTAEEGDHQ